jgi:cystathionine beta-lyase
MKKDTTITTAGRRPHENFGIVNPPVYHASTVLFPDIATLEAAHKDGFTGVRYGRYGTPTSWAFEEAVAALEGGHKAVSVPSGLAAVSVALLALVKTGDHLLVSDNVYGPTRKFCLSTLARLGIETTFFDPMIGERIAELFRPNTRALYTESPGSLTFEMQDVPAFAAAAHAAGTLLVIDNTWSGGLYFQPFAHGVDLSIQAATKYISGHSDAMLGAVTAANEELYRRVKQQAMELGIHAAPDDCYLGLRGLRTLAVRMPRHQETGIRLALWLRDRPEVLRVVHPALQQDPGHRLWRRDFTGASGLFGVMLKPARKPAVDAMLEALTLFGLGYSWGGFESLIIPANPGMNRSAVAWQAEGPYLRIHAGLEDPDDLTADLARGFAALAAAA